MPGISSGRHGEISKVPHVGFVQEALIRSAARDALRLISNDDCKTSEEPGTSQRPVPVPTLLAPLIKRRWCRQRHLHTGIASHGSTIAVLLKHACCRRCIWEQEGALANADTHTHTHTHTHSQLPSPALLLLQPLTLVTRSSAGDRGLPANRAKGQQLGISISH